MAIVTLTSDFGVSDGYVGAMKGVILSRAPAARVIDIAHDIAMCDIAAGAYCLAQAAPYFPDGAIHVAVIDPGVGTERRAVIAVDGRHYFIGPDNGLLTLAVPHPEAAYAIESPAFMRSEMSATFHGRDVFAAAAGFLASGEEPRAAGPEIALAPLELAGQPVVAIAEEGELGAGLRALIVHADHFGNLITNCPGRRVPANARIKAGGQVITGLSRTFADVARGQLVAYIGSGNTLEIAVREGSAVKELGLVPGDTVLVSPGA